MYSFYDSIYKKYFTTATVVEEPELESVYGRVEDTMDLESLRNNPNTDREDEDHEISSNVLYNGKRRSMAIKKTADSSVQVCFACVITGLFDQIAIF